MVFSVLYTKEGALRELQFWIRGSEGDPCQWSLEVV